MNAKNLSPQQLAAINAASISFLAAIAIWVFVHNILIALGTFLFLSIVSYILILFFLQRFIYRRIKLIYKFIHQTKAGKKEEVYYKYILPKKSIDEVGEDVGKWAVQKSNEIELLKKNEAYRKEFLQNLAHEFKTPIFAIQGYVDALLDDELEQAPVRKKFLENASRNIDRLVNLMNDLDEISQLESGEQVLNKQPFIIQDVIREVYESLSIQLNANGIRAVIKKGCDHPILVLADKEKIRQVLINLIQNSVKYGKQNGSISASMYVTDEQHALVEISDDGMGIEAEHLPRIFERFYRTDRGRARDRRGTGLGLAICKHIIEAHGQTIHVRSTPDVGTTIGFTLERNV